MATKQTRSTRTRMTKTRAKLPKSQYIVRECKESSVKPPKARKR